MAQLQDYKVLVMTSLPETIETITRIVRDVAASDPRIRGMYLFGSQVEGEATSESDVDLGVLFDGRVPVREQIRLQLRLSDVLGKEVDLVDVGACNAFLALDIIRGERIYCADFDACDEFDLYVMRRAGDLEPFERARRRMLLSNQKPLLQRRAVRP